MADTAYDFHPVTLEFIGKRCVQRYKSGEMIPIGKFSTMTPIGEDRDGYAQVFVRLGMECPYAGAELASQGEDGAWYYVENHRGTPYWLDGEHDVAPTYAVDLGPLPSGAITVQPKPTTKQKIDELRRAKLLEFEEEFKRVDMRRIRCVCEGEQKNLEYLNSVQAQNRELRRQVLKATTLKELNSISPLIVKSPTSQEEN